jgi:tRNA threonylcarbamoyladenosine biosynthesis protein TsaE
MDTLQKVLSSPEEMQDEARHFIEALPAEAHRATLVTLSGDLGTGKTAFTQFIADALGITDIVNSPTFVIQKVYGIPQNPAFTRFVRLVHIDAYRLQSIGDLTSLGFGEIMSHVGTLVLLEWPEQVTGIAEQASVQIILEALPDGSRQITYA